MQSERPVGELLGCKLLRGGEGKRAPRLEGPSRGSCALLGLFGWLTACALLTCSVVEVLGFPVAGSGQCVPVGLAELGCF